MSSVAEVQSEALSRAVNGQSWANFPAIITGFTEKGIPADDIRPRENVFTFHAWKALGRNVRRGEHGVKVVTYRTVTKKTGQTDQNGAEKVDTFARPWHTTVFHVSQTEPAVIGGAA